METRLYFSPIYVQELSVVDALIESNYILLHDLNERDISAADHFAVN